MKRIPASLESRLEKRGLDNSLRQLQGPKNLIDFSSNDYLGFARTGELYADASSMLSHEGLLNGSSGSRLISGNYPLLETAEAVVASFHNAQSALIFNSGYDANLGFLSSVPQRGDVILYDELSHASIRDGIKLSVAHAFRFNHNDLEHLEDLILKHRGSSHEIYIVTESVFSMDGDSPALPNLVALSKSNGCRLVIDEAHALGVFGERGRGLVNEFKVEETIFARIVTFGKAAGCHGAAILSDETLRTYLINFARSFIYTTAMPPHSAAAIVAAYRKLDTDDSAYVRLRENISVFNREKARLGLQPLFVGGKSAICSAIVPGNDKAHAVADSIQKNGFDVRAILSPTVPQGQERLRICIHSYNTHDEILKLLSLLEAEIF